MKSQNISHLAALLIVTAALGSSTLAGPGPQTPLSIPKRGDGKKIVVLQRPHVMKPPTSPKGPVITYPRPTRLTAGQGTATVWH